ncbi:MAG TPA: GGDEF domain-containing protein [Rubrobacter sp.]|nr:GGDEF domain-containing protein [Rubrobacter sp.]
MNAWLKRNERSHNENDPDDHSEAVRAYEPAYPSPDGSPESGPSRSRSPAVVRFDIRLKTVTTLLYAVGALAVLLVVHSGRFSLPSENAEALDLVVFASGVLVWSVWLFPWHRFGRSLVLVPVSVGLILMMLAAHFSGGWHSPLSVFYLFVVVFCAGYFSAGVVAISVALTLLASLSPQLYDPDSAQLLQHLIVQVPTYFGLALACRYAMQERSNLQFEHDSEQIRNLEERLWHEASLDPLTGLYNRGRFETRFNEEFERARRTDEQFMLLFVDIDDFKDVNDNHGHRMGDEALKLVAQVLQSCSRRIDVVARHGGDEFMVILPGASLPEAHRFFERIRRQVGERAGHTLGLDLRLSAGAVQCPGYSTNPTALLDAVDDAMYRAKRRGKNRMFAALSLAPAEHRRAFPPEE